MDFAAMRNSDSEAWGNFEQLLIVRVDREFQFQGKLIERHELAGGKGKFLQGRID